MKGKLIGPTAVLLLFLLFCIGNITRMIVRDLVSPESRTANMLEQALALPGGGIPIFVYDPRFSRGGWIAASLAEHLPELEVYELTADDLKRLAKPEFAAEGHLKGLRFPCLLKGEKRIAILDDPNLNITDAESRFRLELGIKPSSLDDKI